MSQTFIDWTGGPMPVKPGTPVVTRHRHGKGDKHSLAGDGYATRWEHTADVDDIVAYRLDRQKPQVATSVTERERPVLLALAEYDEDYGIYLKTIAANTGLEYAETRRRVRALARKGLASLVRGLTDDTDGMLRGSGYQLTREGRALAKQLIAEMTEPSTSLDEEPQEIPGKLELFEGKLTPVVDASRSGWWRFHEHYDRNGYCDNPGRGY